MLPSSVDPAARTEAILRDQTAWPLHPFLMLKRWRGGEPLACDLTVLKPPVVAHEGGYWQTGVLIANYVGIAGRHPLWLTINTADFETHQREGGPTTVERLLEQKWVCD